MAVSISPQRNGTDQRPQPSNRHPTAPSVMTVNGHFANIGEKPTREQYEHGLQIIDENQEFKYASSLNSYTAGMNADHRTYSQNLNEYLTLDKVAQSGFDYHLISVFGSQSTGKSTLLNQLFGTDFGVMSEQDRRQTTKGIWMSRNKNEQNNGTPNKMAENILVMDVEGTDGRERGEDQDFERKSALFALATSEVLIVNIWEHQVGLYQGANMGLLKVVFEVNLELFLKDKDKNSSPRSLLFFVIRDHLGTTPLANLRNTLLQDLSRIWSGLSKPPGMEKSRIEDYFDFAFAALPHKILQPERFVSEVAKLGSRFREKSKDQRRDPFQGDQDAPEAVFLPEYHRRIPADGFSIYAEGVWDQIVNNKDLDLPTQQELLAQYRCDEISREVLEVFDESISPFEAKQAEGTRTGKLEILGGLGAAMRAARVKALKNFETEASRYHKGVYGRKRTELENKIDGRLKALYLGQLSAAHKQGINTFSNMVSSAVKSGQKKNASYDFGEIVNHVKRDALGQYEKEAREALVEGTPWSSYKQEMALFQQEINEVTGRLRKEEMRRLAARVERWVRSRLGDSVGLEFNALGSGRGGSGAPEEGEMPSEREIWDRIWRLFVKTVKEAEQRFSDRAKSFDASPDEVDVGKWRLRRKSWGVLRAKIDEEMIEGNLLLKLRENFEDKFRYDEAGVPRIWRPTDDIEGIYTKARESTLTLIPLLSRFQSSYSSSPPPLDDWIGNMPASVTPADEEDLTPIGGVDEEEGKSLEEEMTILTEGKRQDITVRFKKTADGVYVEAKRSAIGGMTQVPLYFYGLLLALGWNEIVAVLRNPVYFVFLILLGAGAYVTYTLNLWGPMLSMANAASAQALEEFKKRLREFLETSETGRQAIAMSGQEDVLMQKLNGSGKVAVDDDEGDEI
ncbi:Dynamin-like GTPase that mediates homotypic ER fusion [Varicellaria rhodocarpa]|nr:Dynamin-like GTPase that mediates homotypic ER fusion [Varicellaria rhodocarpa]